MKKNGWDLSEEDAIKLAITAMQTVIGQEFKSNDIEIGVVSVKNPKFTKLNQEQIEFYLNEVSKKDWLLTVCENSLSINNNQNKWSISETTDYLAIQQRTVHLPQNFHHRI